MGSTIMTSRVGARKPEKQRQCAANAGLRGFDSQKEFKNEKSDTLSINYIAS